MQEELDLRDLVRMVRKRLWMIALLTVVGVGVAGYVSWHRLTPTYEATTIILIGDQYASLLEGAVDTPDTYSGANNINNAIEILKSRTLMERVVERLDLGIDVGSPAFASLRGSVSVQRVSGTDTIRVSVRSSGPERAQLIANTVADVFEEQSRLTNQRAARSAREFLEAQLAVVSADLSDAEQRLLDFTLQERTHVISDVAEQQVRALVELGERRASLEYDLQDARVRLTQLQGRAIAGSSLGATQGSIPVASDLATELTEVRTEISSLEAEIDALDQVIADHDAKLQALPAKELELARLTRDHKVRNEIYLMLLTEYEEARITEGLSVANVQIIDRATLPTAPVHPNKTMNLAIAGILSVFVGLGLTLMLEHFDTSLRTIEEVEKTLGLPIVAQIPLLDLGSSGRRRTTRRVRSRRRKTSARPDDR